MNDFISRQALIDKFRESCNGECGCCEYNGSDSDTGENCRLIHEAPAADVQPVKRGKWIPTGERLPEQGKNVLLCTNGGRVEEGCYFETTEFHTIWKGFVTHGTYWDDEITAWQSLPNPYHAESEDATE